MLLILFSVMEKKFTKAINAWCSYDIANSVYRLIIVTVLFPIYYNVVTPEEVAVFGSTMAATVLYEYTMSFAFLLIAFVAPLLSGIADYGGQRKRFMVIFTFIGALSSMGLYFYSGENIFIGVLFIVLAAIGYEGANLFYNSFLPLIAPKSMHDRVSSRGYSWGYAGAMTLLLICLMLVTFYDRFGISGKLNAIQISFILVGMWWLAFSSFAFYTLKDDNSEKLDRSQYLKKGFVELNNVRKKIVKDVVTRRFLLSFFFYSMGLQTLMLVAVIFGQTEIGVEQNQLIITIIILQVLGIVGAIVFGKISEWRGNKYSIILMLFIWLAVCLGGFFVQTVFQFFILAGAVGLVMGGIQSQSRSTFSKLIPKGEKDTASYFSFYNFTEKIAVVLGMFSFGFIEQLTGSPRNSNFALTVFFIVALLILWKVPLPKWNNEK